MIVLKFKVSQTSMARTSLEPWKFVREMGSSSQWDLIMAPGRETNGDIYGNVFDLQQNNGMLCDIYGNVFDLQQNNGMLCVLIRIASMRRF